MLIILWILHGCIEIFGKFYGFCMDVTLKTPLFSRLGGRGQRSMLKDHTFALLNFGTLPFANILKFLPPGQAYGGKR